jgi:predicted transcriptional regulator of viral defense system
VCNVVRDIDGKRSSTWVDRSIAELASRQHGVVSRDQLRRLGIGDDAIDFRVRCGRLHRVRRGVYSVGHIVISREARRLASALTYGNDAAVSHRAAGAHWGLQQSTAIEVTVPRRVRPRGTIRTHCLPLPPDEVTVHDGVPVTTVVRTIFDLSIYGRRPVERAIHEAGSRRYADALTLADLLERYPNRKGSGVIRAVLGDRRAAIADTDSALEELFLSFLEARGLPVGRTNAWIELPGRWIRGDHVYDEASVIVELDGGTHGTEYGRRADDRRDAAAQAEGWRVMRVSKYALINAPDEVEADLLRLLNSSTRSRSSAGAST